jgi:Transposase family tnp2
MSFLATNESLSENDRAIMVLMYYLRHNLSLAALDDLLTLINAISGQKLLPKSTFLFKKLFPPAIQPNFHFFCTECYLNLDDYDESVTTICPKCSSNVSYETGKGKNFFITFNIEYQIKEILKKNQKNILFKKNNNGNTLITDVKDGKLYDNYQLLSKPITLTINTDGVKVFDSTKSGSLWPIHFVINELAPAIRFKPENLLVSGLWFGSDPKMELFFKPLVQELVELSKKNTKIQINNEIIDVQIRAVLLTADCPAKDKIMKKKQFNGYFGCPYCLHPGKLETNRQIRYTCLGNIEARTHEKVICDMRLAYETETTINGMKGLSPLIGFPKFDIINGLTIDYMHCALLGVTKTLLELWLDSSNHFEEFYIGLRKKEIDRRLLQIKPPSSFSRMPRSISELAMWKANELRNFLLFYAQPCLYGILPLKYLNHFMKLSKSIYILLKQEISEDDFLVAELLLKEFVIEFEKLYGKAKMLFNVHLISHLSNSVRQCGPLWSTSQFHFEDNNHVLINFVKGTTDVLKQISSKYALTKLIEFNPNQSKIVQDFYEKLKNRKNVKHAYKNESFCLLNNYVPVESAQLDKRFSHSEEILYYKRMIFNRIMYHTVEYCKLLKTNDSVVELVDGTLGAIKLITKIENDCFVLLKTITKSKKQNSFQTFQSQIWLIDNLGSTECLIPIASIRRKGVLMMTGSTNSITFLPNVYERD